MKLAMLFSHKSVLTAPPPLPPKNMPATPPSYRSSSLESSGRKICITIWVGFVFWTHKNQSMTQSHNFNNRATCKLRLSQFYSNPTDWLEWFFHRTSPMVCLWSAFSSDLHFSNFQILHPAAQRMSEDLSGKHRFFKVLLWPEKLKTNR